MPGGLVPRLGRRPPERAVGLEHHDVVLDLVIAPDGVVHVHHEHGADPGHGGMVR